MKFHSLCNGLDLIFLSYDFNQQSIHCPLEDFGLAMEILLQYGSRNGLIFYYLNMHLALLSFHGPLFLAGFGAWIKLDGALSRWVQLDSLAMTNPH